VAPIPSMCGQIVVYAWFLHNIQSLNDTTVAVITKILMSVPRADLSGGRRDINEIERGIWKTASERKLS